MKIVPTEKEKERMISYPWLTDRQRDVFEMVYRRGYYHQEAAEILSISCRTVERELQELRKHM